MSAGGTASLARQLEALTGALRAFDDPLGDQLPGVRLMREAVVERIEHVRETLATTTTTALRVAVAGAPVRDGRVDATVVAALVTALQDGVDAAAADLEPLADVPVEARRAAVRLHLAAVEAEDDTVTLQLQEPPGDPDERLVVDADGTGAVEAALGRVLGALQEPTGAAGALAAAVRRIAEVVRDQPLRLVATLLPAVGEGAEVSLGRPAAQRLLHPPAPPPDASG